MDENEQRLLDFYEKMLIIRKFEDKVEELYALGQIPGLAHPYQGQEAVAVGVCSALKNEDYILSNHRGHGHSIAKGVPPKHIMAELFGKVDGVCKGIGGSMHSTYLEAGVLFSTAIVGGGIPIATGVGLAIKNKSMDNVVACFFGDGATNTGAFHEGVNLASLWKLPVIFVCENNHFALSTPVLKSVPVKNIADRALAYGIKGIKVDGMDVVKVYNATKEALVDIRNGGGPILLVCETYRFKGHGMYDTAFYREKEEVEKWLDKDPLNIIKRKWLKDKEISFIKEKVEKIIEDSVEYAKNSSYPTWDLMIETFNVEEKQNEH
jgi:TPP-dependent pyruvate/acetoin dehydrogenase alpha subunit